MGAPSWELWQGAHSWPVSVVPPFRRAFCTEAVPASADGDSSARATAAAAVATVAWRKRRRLWPLAEPARHDEGATRGAELAECPGGKDAPTLLEHAVASDTWQLPLADIQVDVDADGRAIHLGHGACGVVLRGTLRGVQPAAIKVLTKLGPQTKRAFLREAAVMRHANRDGNVLQVGRRPRVPCFLLSFLLVSRVQPCSAAEDASVCTGCGALEEHARAVGAGVRVGLTCSGCCAVQLYGTAELESGEFMLVTELMEVRG